MSKKLIDIIVENGGYVPSNDINQQRLTTEDKKNILSKISTYNSVGKTLYAESDMIQIAKTLLEIAEGAQRIALDETEDAFDKITVNRNMKELKSLSEQFSKAATEAQAYKQRLTGLYEDMGHLLSRFFHIEDLQNVSELPSTVMESVQQLNELDPSTYDSYISKISTKSPTARNLNQIKLANNLKLRALGGNITDKQILIYREGEKVTISVVDSYIGNEYSGYDLAIVGDVTDVYISTSVHDNTINVQTAGTHDVSFDTRSAKLIASYVKANRSLFAQHSKSDAYNILVDFRNYPIKA